MVQSRALLTANLGVGVFITVTTVKTLVCFVTVCILLPPIFAGFATIHSISLFSYFLLFLLLHFPLLRLLFVLLLLITCIIFIIIIIIYIAINVFP